MHSSLGQYGGDLKNDTVTIIGATLDLQEKVVSQVIESHCICHAAAQQILGHDPDQGRIYVID